MVYNRIKQLASEATLPTPDVELTEDILYNLLVAEIAGQRELLKIATEKYVRLAYQTRNLSIVARAARIALYAHYNQHAEEVATLWLQIDADSLDARKILLAVAFRRGQREKAEQQLNYIAQSAPELLSEQLWIIASLIADKDNHTETQAILDVLISGHQHDPKILSAYAQLLIRMNELERARTVLEQILTLVPEDQNSVAAYVYLLRATDESGVALQWLENTLKDRQDNLGLRLLYARFLMDIKRFDDARRQFEILVVQSPYDPNVLFSLGLLYIYADRLEDAKFYLQRLIKNESDNYDALYYLGRIAEENEQFLEADEWYQQVQSGRHYFDSQIRLGVLLAKQGKLEDSLHHLHQIQVTDVAQQTILVQAEAQVLIDTEQYDVAMEVYSKALKHSFHSNNADLLYARAMLAEKIDRLDILESDLKKLLERHPENAQALNALGYTLADRTDRFDEAYVLIKRALEIMPRNFYVLDSMGWVLYRQGRLDEAIEYLSRALATQQDPEIAAHLGEVLWKSGDKESARNVWEAALQTAPDDDKLLDTLKRFAP